MIALYIMAGFILGWNSIAALQVISIRQMYVPIACNIMMAFVGGVAGHLLFNLVYN